MKNKDISGKTFGQLKVVVLLPEKYHRRNVWLCKCSCGKKIKVSTNSLTSGNTKSCGCVRRLNLLKRNTTHNLSKTKLYTIWGSMKARCYNNKHPQYKDYGGRKIYLSDPWFSFEKFYEDMSPTYIEGVTIERIDNNKGYSKENCTWTTREVQNNNKRNNRFLVIDNKKLTVAEWARKTNIPRTTLSSMLNKYKKSEDYVIDKIRKSL